MRKRTVEISALPLGSVTVAVKVYAVTAPLAGVSEEMTGGAAPAAVQVPAAIHPEEAPD